MKDIKIIVATHKTYKMPEEDIYLPVHVGAEGKGLELGFQKDNQGDNISVKNPSFCELTGLYWAWKNLQADYVGLAHYRRHFSLIKKGKDPFKNVLTKEEATKLIEKYRILVPAKRKYYIESLYSHYAHTHYEEHLDITRDIIKDKYPQYLNSYDKVVKQTWGYMFNMMVMEKELLNNYCTWLFDILFELEVRLQKSSSGLSAFQGRFYGRVSEIIFNVWLAQQINEGNIKITDIKEVNCIYMENIDWPRKIKSFLMAKFFHKKYDGSF